MFLKQFYLTKNETNLFLKQLGYNLTVTITTIIALILIAVAMLYTILKAKK